MPFPSAAACPMQTADARRPWSLGRGGQTPSSIKFRTKSSGKTLTRILADSILIRLHSPHPLRSPLPRCALRTSDLIYEAAFSGEDNGEEAGRKEPGRAREGRREGRREGSELCDTFDPLDWKMAAASLWPPPPPAPAAGLDTFASDTLAKQILPDIRSSRGRLLRLPNERSIGISNQRNSRTLAVAVVMIYQADRQGLKTSSGVTWLCLNLCRVEEYWARNYSL